MQKEYNNIEIILYVFLAPFAFLFCLWIYEKIMEKSIRRYTRRNYIFQSPMVHPMLEQMIFIFFVLGSYFFVFLIGIFYFERYRKNKYINKIIEVLNKDVKVECNNPE